MTDAARPFGRDVRVMPGVPPEVAAAILPHLDRWRWLIPGWCRQLFVYYSPDDTENLLSCKVEPAYRFASLFVCPKWLAEPEQLRAQYVAHECAHILTGPLVTVARGLADDYVPEGPARTAAFRMIRDAMEGAVCDIEQAVIAGAPVEGAPPPRAIKAAAGVSRLSSADVRSAVRSAVQSAARRTAGSGGR